MSGRFLAPPFLVSILVLSFMDFRRKTLLTICVLVITYNILHPWAPIKSDAEKPWDHPYIYHRNVYDEAGGYRRGTNLLHFFPFSGDRPSETFPKYSQYEAWARFGRLLKEKESPLAVPLGGGMGYLGFFAGPGPFIIDGFAITDPFLARLVVPEAASLDYQPGHVKRYIPRGYIESIITGENMIEDPELKEYYRKLAIITRGELFNRERMRYVLEFNLGGMKRFDRVPSPLANLPESGFLRWP